MATRSVSGLDCYRIFCGEANREPMLFRHATNDDLMIVASWIKSPRDCEFWAGHALTYPLQLDTLAKDIDLSPETSFCVDDDQIFAFGQLIDKGNGRVHLAKIIVNPETRGCGIGKKLVAALIGRAKEKSFSVIGLNVHPDNHLAINLYKKLGFELAERPASLAAGRGSLYMSLVLQN
ncbi:MAG: N-acetyltransferase [Steroidobacter sp.]